MIDEWDGMDSKVRLQAGGMLPPKIDYIERHPDKRASDAAVVYEEKGNTLTCGIPVRGLGCIILRSNVTDLKAGRRDVKVTLVTDEEALFG